MAAREDVEIATRIMDWHMGGPDIDRGYWVDAGGKVKEWASGWVPSVDVLHALEALAHWKHGSENRSWAIVSGEDIDGEDTVCVTLVDGDYRNYLGTFRPGITQIVTAPTLPDAVCDCLLALNAARAQS